MTEKEEKTYSISELAKEFDITTRSIRFYEDQGLITPVRNGQTRIYSKRDRVRLKLILRGKRLGLSLDESAEIVLMYGTPGNNRKQLEKLIDRIRERRSVLENQQRELVVMLNELQAAEERCQLALNELS